MNLHQFSAANLTRCLKWHPQGIESWSTSDWLVAIMGELGELAGLVKMRNRERDGLPGNKFSPTNEQLAKEAADVFTYLDLFCTREGIDLGAATVAKFNEVSERVGFPDRIGEGAEQAELPPDGEELVQFFGVDSDRFAAYAPGVLLVMRSRLIRYLRATMPQRPLSEERIAELAALHAPPIHPEFEKDDSFVDLVRAVERELRVVP